MMGSHRLKQRFINNVVKRIPPLKKNFFYSHTYEGVRFNSMLIHNIAKGYPKTQGVITPDITPTDEDRKITKRLIKAYKSATKESRGASGKRDMWDVLEDEFYAEFIKLLEEEEVDK